MGVLRNQILELSIRLNEINKLVQSILEIKF
jgi:hypothetical protein